MSKTTPTIRDGTLIVVRPDGGDSDTVAVGSDEWLAWLEQGRPFAFADPTGHYSARKRGRGRTSYWYGLRRVEGRLYELYIGTSKNVTLDRLREVATDFTQLIAKHSRVRPSLPPARRRGGAAGARSRTTSLLPGKTHIPEVSLAQLVRTRAADLLAGADLPRLTTLIAPPGYGKTTLLAQWSAIARPRLAWVSLDEADNDIVRFWTYVSAGLDQVIPGLFDALLPLIRSPRAKPSADISAALLHDLSATPDSLALVLDDFDVIRSDNAELLNAVALLVEHLPPHVHLVLASRQEPPLPLARLRMQGQLLGFRDADLQFSLEETADFCTRLINPQMSPTQVLSLHEQTHSWVAALQLARLSLQGGAPSANAPNVFDGGNRLVFDLLADEVIRRLPEDMQWYLVQISLFDRFSASLCDAVTRTRVAHAMLAEMERLHLFLVVLDDRHEWYRFHPLFAQALRHYLHQSQPERVCDLYARASIWYETNGDWSEAIDCAFAATDAARAAQLTEAYAPFALERGYFALLREKIERLPDELVRERPRLCLAHAYTLMMSWERTMVPHRLRQAEKALAHLAHTLDPSDCASLQAELTALRLELGLVSGNDSPRSVYQHALANMPPRHPLRTRLGIVLGVHEMLSGDGTAAGETLLAVKHASEATGDVYNYALSLLFLGMVTRMQRCLHDALDLCRKAAETIGMAERGAAADRTAIDLVLGWTSFERNELDAAVAHLRACAVRSVPHAPLLGEGLPTLAYAYHAQGNDTAARDTVDQALAGWERAREEGRNLMIWTIDQLRAHQARLWVLQGDIESASRWARRIERSRPILSDTETHEHVPLYVGEWEQMVIARIYLT